MILSQKVLRVDCCDASDGQVEIVEIVVHIWFDLGNYMRVECGLRTGLDLDGRSYQSPVSAVAGGYQNKRLWRLRSSGSSSRRQPSLATPDFDITSAITAESPSKERSGNVGLTRGFDRIEAGTLFRFT